MKKIFNIALRPLDRRVIQAAYGKACRLRLVYHMADHFQVHGTVAHHAFFTDLVTPGLKLRFDQTDHFSVFLQQQFGRSQHFGQGNEGYVHRSKVQDIPDIFRRHIGRIPGNDVEWWDEAGAAQRALQGEPVAEPTTEAQA